MLNVQLLNGRKRSCSRKEVRSVIDTEPGEPQGFLPYKTCKIWKSMKLEDVSREQITQDSRLEGFGKKRQPLIKSHNK